MNGSIGIYLNRCDLEYSGFAWDSNEWRRILKENYRINIYVEDIDSYIGTIYRSKKGYNYETTSDCGINATGSYIDLFIVEYLLQYSFNKVKKQHERSKLGNDSCYYAYSSEIDINKYERLRNDFKNLVPGSDIKCITNDRKWIDDIAYVKMQAEQKKQNPFHESIFRIKGLAKSNDVYYAIKFLVLISKIGSDGYKYLYEYRKNILLYEKPNQERYANIRKWINGKDINIADIEIISD